MTHLCSWTKGLRSLWTTLSTERSEDREESWGLIKTWVLTDQPVELCRALHKTMHSLERDLLKRWWKWEPLRFLPDVLERSEETAESSTTDVDSTLSWPLFISTLVVLCVSLFFRLNNQCKFFAIIFYYFLQIDVSSLFFCYLISSVFLLCAFLCDLTICA